MRFALLSMAAVAMLVFALAGCGGDDSPAGAETAPNEPFARAVLKPTQSGGSGSIEVTLEESSPQGPGTIQVEGSGLEKAQGSSEYALWLVGPPEEMFLLATYPVGGNGQLHRKPEVVSPSAFSYVGDEGFTEAMVSKANPTRLRTAMTASGATEVPAYFGDEVLRGRFEGSGVGPNAAQAGP
jgi:hypothetical protein